MGKKTQRRCIHSKTVRPPDLQYQEKVMPHQTINVEHQNLGEFLREKRIDQGKNLAAIADETKVPLKCLRAIEESDFTLLPAEAYARGFYALYAKCLSLDPEEILHMYTQERPNQRKSLASSMLPKNKLAQEVGNMAERPSFLPFSFFGLFLLLLLLFGGFLCWYFSWNPATYLSQKLRSLDEPQQMEQVSKNQSYPDVSGSNYLFAGLQRTHSGSRNLFGLSYPAIATAADVAEGMTDDPAPSPSTDTYLIKAKFKEETRIKLQIDNLPAQTLHFKTGESATWRAKAKAVVTLPSKSKTKITLNNTSLDLPETDNEFVTLYLPEDQRY